MCEPTASLVHRAVLQRSGATFDGARGRPEVEFLASNDRWFRPVFLTDGPDGALYVVDMCRKVVEHPDWMPDLAERTDLWAGAESGRIWRIRKRPAHSAQPVATLSNESVESLVSTLSSPTQWRRRNAARLLLQRQDPKLPSLLRSLYRECASPLGRAAAVQLISALGESSGDASVLEKEADDEVRRLLLISSETPGNQPTSGTQWHGQLKRAMHHGPPWLRFQALLSTATHSDEFDLDRLIRRCVDDSKPDEWMQIAELAVLSKSADAALLRMADRRDDEIRVHQAFVRRLAVLAASQDGPLSPAMARLLRPGHLLADGGDLSAFGRVALLGLAQGIAQRHRSVSNWLSKQSPQVQSSWRAACDSALLLTLDGDAAEEDRLTALETLSLRRR